MPRLSEEKLIRLHGRVWSKEHPELLIYLEDVNKLEFTRSYEMATRLLWTISSKVYGFLYLRPDALLYFNGGLGYQHLNKVDLIEVAEVMSYTLTLLRTLPVEPY